MSFVFLVLLLLFLGDLCLHARASRTDNLGHLEEQVSEVTHLLKNNVEKVVERGERIDVLQSRSGKLCIQLSRVNLISEML